MAYSTVDDVRKALSPNGNPYDNDSPSSYTDEMLQDQIIRADAQIDLSLRAKYTVPVAAPDALLKDWSSSIAAYLAALVQSGGDDIEKTDPIQLRYDRVVQALNQVVAGVVVLPYPVDAVDGQAGDTAGYNRYEGELFLSDEFFDPCNPYDDPSGYPLFPSHRPDGTRW